MSIRFNDGNGDDTLTLGDAVQVTFAPGDASPLTDPGIDYLVLSETQARISVTVYKASTANPVTIHWRIKSGAAPSNKEPTPTGDFPAASDTVVTAPGTYTFLNGGSLDRTKTYYVGTWLEDMLANETNIVTAGPFSTASSSPTAAPSNLRWASGSAPQVSEDTAVGTVIGQLAYDGAPGARWSMYDPDGKFSLDPDTGIVTLAAALDYETRTSHALKVAATLPVGTDAPTSTTVTDGETAINERFFTDFSAGVPSIMKVQTGFTITGNSLPAGYTTVENGQLVMKVRNDNGTMKGSYVTTQFTEFYPYSKISARVRLDPDGYTDQAVFTKDWYLGSTPGAGTEQEIDIEMLHYANGTKKLWRAIHHNEGPNYHAEVTPTIDLWDGEYHVVSIERSTDRIKWFIDGVQQGGDMLDSTSGVNVDSPFRIELQHAGDLANGAGSLNWFGPTQLNKDYKYRIDWLDYQPGTAFEDVLFGAADLSVAVADVDEGGGGAGGSGGGDTIYASVGSINAFKTLVESWPVSGGVIQVPGGVPRVIQLTASSSNSLVPSTPYKFSHMVTLTGQGSTFTSGWNNTAKKPTGGASKGNLTGTINLSGFRNFTMKLLKLTNLVSLIDGATDVKLHRCMVWGAEFDGTTDRDAFAGQNFIVEFSNCTRVVLERCHLAFAATAFIQMRSNNTDCGVKECVGDLYRNDPYKWVGQNNIRPFMINNLGPRSGSQVYGNDGKPAHTDYLQTAEGTYTDAVLYGDIFMPTIVFNNGAKSMKGWYLYGNSTHTRVSSEQNVFCNNQQWGMVLGTHSGTCPARYNTLLTPGDSQINADHIGGGGFDYDYNMVADFQGTARGAGPNGVKIDTAAAATQGAFTTANYLSCFYGVPDSTKGLQVMRPKAGTRAHWSHANPAGAYLTLKRVFKDMNWQLEWGWPVAEPAKRQYDQNDYFTTTGYPDASGAPRSSYTGSYDANGDNA